MLSMETFGPKVSINPVTYELLFDIINMACVGMRHDDIWSYRGGLDAIF